MKKLVIFGLGLSLWIIGCGNSGNNSNSPFSTQSAGTFNVAQSLPTTDTSRYTTGCATPGQSTATAQIDPRLQIGMVFNSGIRLFDGTNNYSIALQNTIAAVTPQLVENMKVLAVSGIPGIQAGFTTQATYTLSNGAFSVAYNPAITNVQIPNASCQMNISGTGTSTSTLSSGQFTDTSGRVFTAQKLAYHITGGLTCSGTASATGAMDFVSIVTNDLPSEGSATFCGGVALFTAEVLTKSDGTILYGVAVERTSSSVSRRSSPREPLPR